MKRMLVLTLVIGLGSFGLIGCTEKTSSTTQETELTTPGGTTTITTEREIETTGDHTPATP